MAPVLEGVSPLRLKSCSAAALIFLWILVPGLALARDLFVTVITVGGETASNSTNSFQSVGNLFDEATVAELFPTYQQGLTAYSAVLDFRGVITGLSFDAGADVFRFQIPALGIALDFTGGSRDSSVQQFGDWLRGENVGAANSQNSLTPFLRALVAQSPVDPVAGNPNSLESRMFESDLGLGTLGSFLEDFSDNTDNTDNTDDSAKTAKPPNVWKLDFDFGHFAAGPHGGETYDLDIAFGWNVNRRIILMADLATMFSVAEGEALTGLGNFGLGLQGRIAEGWNLALMVRGGVVGSVDVGAVAAMVTVSLVNHMGFDFSEYRLEMSNMVGFASSIDGIEIEGIALNYDGLTNVVLKNGLSLYRELGGSRPLRARLFLTDTQYFGDDLWLEHSDEIGLGLGMAASKDGVRTYDPVALDLSYVFGSAYDAFHLKLSFRF